MKRENRPRLFVAMILVIALIAALVGCSNGGNTPGDTGNTTETAEPAVTITVSAAASLTDAFDAVSAAYTAAHPNVTFSINYGASGTLQEQLSQGAVADIFFSASKKYMDAVEEDGLVLAGTRANILANEIVVIVSDDSTLDITGIEDLTSPEAAIIALGDPDAVPAGKYAKQSLVSAGIDEDVYAKAVLGKDVREVLTYVETGDADAGIVYMTDTVISDAVRIAVTIPSDTHDPIVYPAAVLNVGDSQEAAKAFLEYLTTDEALTIFEEYGFSSGK